jgi:hypothetical protein
MCKNRASVNRRVLKRHFGEDNIREFKYLSKKGDMAGSIFRDRAKCKIQGFYELSSSFL